MNPPAIDSSPFVICTVYPPLIPVTVESSMCEPNISNTPAAPPSNCHLLSPKTSTLFKSTTPLLPEYPTNPPVLFKPTTFDKFVTVLFLTELFSKAPPNPPATPLYLTASFCP